MPVERDDSIIELCRQTLERLAASVPATQLSCHMRVGGVLRVVAASGGLRLIYEVPESEGGICWRAARTGEPQLVEDVRSDPEYIATDERVLAEVAVPVTGGDDVLLVLDAEFAERSFLPEEAEAVQAEAAALESAIRERAQ